MPSMDSALAELEAYIDAQATYYATLNSRLIQINSDAAGPLFCSTTSNPTHHQDLLHQSPREVL